MWGKATIRQTMPTDHGMSVWGKTTFSDNSVSRLYETLFRGLIVWVRKTFLQDYSALASFYMGMQTASSLHHARFDENVEEQMARKQHFTTEGVPHELKMDSDSDMEQEDDDFLPAG